MFGKKKKGGEPDGAPSASSSASEGLSDELKPKDLPKPDGLKKLPPSPTEPGGTNTAVMRTKKKARKSKGGCGCLLLLTVLVMIPIGLLAAAAIISIKQFDDAGFVQEKSGSIKLVDTPEEKTLFIAGLIDDGENSVPVEVAYTGLIVELSGTYQEDVYIRALIVNCAPGTVFEKDLEVFAATYHNQGTVIGELTGSVIRQEGITPPDD